MADKTRPPRTLIEAAKAGLPFNEGNRLGPGQVIEANLIRKLILGLAKERGEMIRLTPAGIEIHHARINGRVSLDKVTAAGGGAVAPIEFHHCYLTQGFSGAHGRFSRLCFRGCTFGDPDPPMEDGRHIPTVELTDAEIHSDLDMEGVRAEGVESDDLRGQDEGPYLWIKATGARIDGEINLSGCYVRAAPGLPERPGEDPPDAIDLSLADVAGDFRFRKGSRALGRIKCRNTKFNGDVWLSGASLDGAGGQALLLQSAHIAGLLVIDSRFDDIAGLGVYRWFHSRGQLNFFQLRLGGKLFIKNANIEPSADIRPSVALTGLEAQASPPVATVGLTLEGAQVGGSVEILADPGVSSCLGGQLRLADLEVKTEVHIENVCLGLDEGESAERFTIEANSLSAETLTLKGVRPLPKAVPAGWFAPRPRLLSLDLSGATLGTLRIEGSRFTGRLTATPLHCAGDVHLNGRVGGEVDLAGAEIGGSLDISNLRMDPSAKYLSVKGGTIGHALRLARPRKPGARAPKLLRARRTQLRSLPDTTLIETLWEYEPDLRKSVYRQSAFLERKGGYYLLDRRADVLGDFVERHGHSIKDTEAAREYFRLHCDYGPSELPFRWLIPAPDQLPPFAFAHPKQNAMEGRQSCAGASSDDSILLGPADGGRALEELAEIDFIVTCEEGATTLSGRKFEIGARLVCGDLLARGRFHLFVGGRKQAHVQSCSGPERAVRLAHLPVADGQHLEHPSIAGSTDQWVTPPALEVWAEVDAKERDWLEAHLSPHLSSGFSMQGRIDLNNLTCTTLEDRAGRLWGHRARISMNHFTYRQAQWYPRTAERKKSHLMLRDRLLAHQAEWLWPFRRGRRADCLRERDDYWEPWQVRRNWIYQQFSKPPEEEPAEPEPVAICRHRIDEPDYRPQPFEQAIRVARAEGREDFAIHFEMLKQRIEWRLFNRMVRWWLGFIGIGLAALWLLINHPDEPRGLFGLGPTQWATLATLVVTLALMVGASMIHAGIRKLFPWLPHAGRAFLTWVVFFIPAFILWRATDWWQHPAHFFIAFLIFVMVRCISVFAYWTMRFGFGYLRRPVRAVGTLIVAFLLGWLGVAIANERGMLVINAEPVAGLVREHGRDGLVGMNDGDGTGFVHNVPCVPTISRPLYALDVLIPLIDLREESRCEVRRVPESEVRRPPLSQMDLSELWRWIPQLTLGNYRFWWLMKALYAILGWFIVSLSILTFAQANRTHAEPPTEKK